MRCRRGGGERRSGCGRRPATPSFPKARVFNAHTQPERASPVWPMNQRGVGGWTMELHNRRLGRAAAVWGAGAITAQGSNGQHLAAELHSHSSLFVSGAGGGLDWRQKEKTKAELERLVWPLRECRRKEESVARLKGGKRDECGGRGHQKVLC